MREKWLIDWKSSRALYPEYEIQVATYSGLNWNITKEDIQKVGVLILDKETGLPTFYDCSKDNETNWDAFMHLREYYRIKVEPFIDLKRFYPYEDKKFPSVTAILDILNKPALIQWSANETVNHFQENIDKLRDPATEQSTVDYIFKKAKTAYRQTSKKAMDTGTIVHDAIEAFMSGMPVEDILGTNEQAKTAFDAFVQWKEKVKLESIHLEYQLIDPVSETGGTCDFIGYAEVEEETNGTVTDRKE
jgi:hypothetical protein